MGVIKLNRACCGTVKMAKVESKTNMSIDIEVKSDNQKAGHLMLIKGSVYYYRTNVKKETPRYTCLQLIDLIEQDLDK